MGEMVLQKRPTTIPSKTYLSPDRINCWWQDIKRNL